MAIQIYVNDGRAGLVAKCDVCGEHVEADNGNMIWQDSTWEDGNEPDHFIACKVNSKGKRCSRQIELTLLAGSKTGVSMTCLDQAVLELMENCQVNEKEARRRFNIMQRSIP